MKAIKPQPKFIESESTLSNRRVSKLVRELPCFYHGVGTLPTDFMVLGGLFRERRWLLLELRGTLFSTSLVLMELSWHQVNSGAALTASIIY